MVSVEAKIVFGGLGLASILWGIQGIVKETELDIILKYTSPELLGQLIKSSLLLLAGITLLLVIGIMHTMEEQQ